jgi:midasin
MDYICSLLEQSSNEPFRVAIKNFSHPPHSVDRPSSRQESISNLGLYWISLSRLIIGLYVPDKPVDPAIIQSCSSGIWRQERENILSQIRLHSQLERRITGGDCNNVVIYLNHRLGEITELLATSSAHTVNRPNISRLHIFWTEVSQFINQVVSPSRINSLLSLDPNDTSAAMREYVIQQSIAGFCQRLDTVYPEYADLHIPIQLALLHTRMGLRFISHSVTCDSSVIPNPVTLASRALIAFPAVQSIAMLLSKPDSNISLGKFTSQHPLLKLAAIGLEHAIGVDLTSHIHIVEMAYDQILRLWLIERAREDGVDLASQSLYKHKHLDYGTISDAELEEQEFLALFPHFEDVLQQELQPQAKDKSRATVLVDTPQISQLVAIHHHLFSSTSHSSLQQLAVFEGIRRTELETLLEGEMSSLSDVIDSESLSFQFSVLDDRLSGLQGTHKSTETLYDFYGDPNILEIKKAAKMVEALQIRLDALILEWPDQMVLQHLRGRCEVALGLDLHSPVAKMLSALEHLLTETEDWEIYANRENSLKDHQHAMTGLIVSWRRLELSSWQALLQIHANSFADGASHWWFRLYDATIRGSLDVLNREILDVYAFTEYLNKLVPLLDDFIRSSPLGQYTARIQLLQSFTNYINHLALSKDGTLRLGLQRVGHITQTTAAYYGSFSDLISGHFREQRVALEKEILGFIKLASWKDINVYALKQSAQKTHRQLYKSVRKFRDIMRQPITPWLQPELAGMAESKYLVDYAAPVLAREPPRFPEPHSAALPGYLSNLSKTFQKYDTLVNVRIRTFIRSHASNSVDSLAVEIISTAKDLSSISVSKGTSEKKEKQQKALIVRKKKAWNDLLKELKRRGFTANMKPDVLDRQRDVRWIREQPVISNLRAVYLSVERSEKYFNCIQGSLPELRSRLSEHHSDVTTRDLQRGIMLLESNFSIALDTRSWYEIMPYSGWPAHDNTHTASPTL